MDFGIKKPAVPAGTCKSCRFWVTDKGVEHGACRRFPPTVTLIGMGKDKSGTPQPLTSTNWPATLPAHFCGEHQAKVVPQGAS